MLRTRLIVRKQPAEDGDFRYCSGTDRVILTGLIYHTMKTWE